MKSAQLAAVLGSVALSWVLLAQWPALPGDTDLIAPAPRSPDGRPDFSGVWSGGGPGGGKGKDFKDKAFKDKGFKENDKGKLKAKGPTDGAKGKGKGPLPGPDGIAPGGFLNMGASMPGGLLPYQDAALALRNQRLSRNSADHPDAHCLPLHPIQLWFHPQPRKLIQAAREIVMLAEANDGRREIFTDGRALPNPAEVQPWWYGYSVGKWDGDTLVVESSGFLDDAWIDEQGSPLSNQARVVERVRRPNFGTLEVEITVTDPQTYTRPWTVTSTQRLLPNEELIEFVCAENNTSVQHLVTK